MTARLSERIGASQRAFVFELVVASGLVIWGLSVALLPISAQSRLVLLVLPAILYLINRFTAATLCALIVYLPLDVGLSHGDAVIAFPVLVLVICGFGLLNGRWQIVPGLVAVIAALSALLLISLESSTGQDTTVSSTRDLLTLLFGLGICLVAAATRPSIEATLIAVGLAGIAVAGVVITGAFGQVFHSADILDLQSIDRVTALGLNPNYLGLIFSLAIVAIAGVAANRRNPLLLAATIPCWVALGETKSRGSIFVIGIGLLFVYLFGRAILTRISIVGGLLIIVLVSPNVVNSFFGAILGARVSEGFITDTNARVEAAKLAIKLSLQHPLIGIGYGNFLSHAASSPTIGVPLATHDDYLRVASEAGIPALLLLLALITMGILAMRRIPNGNIGIALIAAYCAALFTENTLSNLPITVGFWVLIGSAIGIDALQSPKDEVQGEPKELRETVG